MRQRTKFGIALGVLALVLTGVVFGALTLFGDQARAQAQDQLAETAEVAGNQTRESLRQSQEVMRRFGSRGQTANYSRSGLLLQTLTNNSEYVTAAMIDENWNIRDVRGDIKEQARRSVIGTNGSTPYVREAYRSGSVVTSKPIWDPEKEIYFIEVAAANYKPNGNVTGVVAARLDVDSFLSPASTLNTTYRTVQVRAWNGSDIVKIREPSQSFDDPLTANETVSLGDLSWTVNVIQDRRSLTQRLDQLTIIQAGSLVVVFLSVIGLGYWEYSTNLKQTERLLEGFAKLREGDYEYTISLSSATEWQRISDGYNELTQGLAERERQIREREQQLEVLNRVLRHNLQNDMNVIIGHAEMLPRFSEDDRVEDAAETIVRMGEGLVSHGRKARHLETVMGGDDEIITADAVTIAETAVARYDDTYEDTAFRLEGTSRALVEVSDAFEYAVENLIENAAEHNDADDPLVEITVTSNEQTVDLQITDNGPGIPEHEYEVLQEGAESALQHGSGVGLWLAHWIVERSDGWLSFADRSPRGSIVTVTVPGGSDEDDEEGEVKSGDGADTAGVGESD